MIPSTDILIRLVIGHLIGDFFLQPKTWVDERNIKHYKSGKLYMHASLHAIISGLLTWNMFKWEVPIIFFITHLLIDLFKSYRNKKYETSWFLLDQALHILVIAGTWKALYASTYELKLFSYLFDVKFLIVAIAILILSKPAAIFIGIATQKWREEIAGDKKETLKDAGLWIGIIERILILVFILINKYEAIGFLLAAKSIFRIGDLSKTREKNQTEYLMIGTLLSFGIALIVGYLTRQILF